MVRWKKPALALASVGLALALGLSGAAPEAAAAAQTYKVFAPLAFKPAAPPTCPASSGNSYAAGGAAQWDIVDNPVRPAHLHADKNLALRGYNSTSAAKGLVNYGSDDPTQPPQLATLFNPNRLPAFSGVYRANQWNWATSPAPGSAGGPILDWPVTVLGLATTPGEALRVPASGYDIGGGMEVLVLFADADSIAFKYTREDSVAPNGYLVHVDNICTDVNLLALYNSLNQGARYVYLGVQDHNVDYNLPNLPAGQVFGTARGGEVRVAVVDSGTFLDPRSCNEWWQIRPGHPGC
ncbi:MAG: hypothetical protein IT317_03505 [Anaerolineales bacterium]|nr:hypothetical protein [Anaerolineales bacterium]